MRRSLYALVISALSSVMLLSTACAQQRTIPRDPLHGGPSGVRLDELSPYFPSDALVEASGQLNDDNPDPAIATLEAWITAHPEDPQRHRASFLLAYGYYTDARYGDALPLLRACADDYPLMSDYCLFWAARASEESGDLPTARTLAQLVSPDAVYGPRSQYLVGRVALALEDYNEAISTLEAFLERYPNAYYREDLEFDLAAAYRAVDRLDDAALVYHRIALLNPGRDDEERANNALDEIRSGLSDATREAVSSQSTSETLERAQVLFDAHRSERVIALLEPVIAELSTDDPIYCDANYLTGKSYSKLRQHSSSVPFYENVVAHCHHDEDLRVRGLYNLGRGLWNADRDPEALDAFEVLWTEHASNSYADDGMLLAARVLRSNDDEEGYVAMLEQQIAMFPDGDMLKDATWLLMERYILAGDHRGAVRFADELGAETGENDLYSRGRIRYFRAVSLEALSLTQEAASGYADVMRHYPMSYYALLAFNRLRALDVAQAEALLAELHESNDQTEGFIAVDPPQAGEHGAFLRGTDLLRLGLFSLAENEFKQLEGAFPNADELGWVISLLYDRAGAYHLSHHVPGERQDLRLHYPAGDNLERWEIAYPRPFWDIIEANAAERQIDPFMVLAIMREESGFQPGIESWANARGLMQLMIGTARDMGELTGRGSVSERDLFEPEINVELGTMFMRSLSDSFETHPAMIIGGYNGGRGNIRSWLRERGEMPLDLWVEEIPYQQTRNYVKRVTMSYWIYRWLYAEADPYVVLPFDVSGILDE